MLVAADLVAFLVLVAPVPRPARHAAALAASAAVAQVLAEGARWPMAPAYALAAVLTAAWLWRGALRGRWAIAAGLAVAVALPLVLPVFRFPRPSGPYGIGTLTYHWTDDRPELLGPDPAARRELMVQIWYPARPDPSAPRVRYVEDPAVLAAVAGLGGTPELTFQHLRHVTTNAVAAAPAVPGRHPVLLFLEGALGFRQMNTFQVEELVSQLHGRAFPDGMIPHLARDVPFVLDRLAALDRSDRVLAGRLDLGRAGAFGVSLGGIVTGQACRLEPRLRACLIMDAALTADVVRSGLDRPTLWLTRDAATMRREGWDDAEVAQHQDTMRAVHDRLPSAGYLVFVPDAYHGDFTDVPAWSPLVRLLGFAGPVGADRARAVVNAYTLGFFDRHLKGVPAPALDTPPDPGVRVESR
ncbi:carboxylic ester hydrolase [Nonomuraea aridisoli]|uniref:Carboxylic ester hydrolase n=1 Tax=Nonomuraea aridisoli TaxID=2070368 RepID=A0A2W2DKN4_9ACTN|nr:carboxylic ester hydrolase [Nonomuraea aridisoli]